MRTSVLMHISTALTAPLFAPLLDQCLSSLGFNQQSLELATLEIENSGLAVVDLETFLGLCEKFIDVDP